MRRVYRSRVDAYVLAWMAGVPSLLLVLGWQVMGRAPVAGGLQMLLGGLVAVLILLLSFPCTYALGDEGLSIRCGLLREEIGLERIRSAEPCTGYLAAQGLSTRRVRIILTDGEQRVISPREREEFLTDLRRLLSSRAGK